MNTTDFTINASDSVGDQKPSQLLTEVDLNVTQSSTRQNIKSLSSSVSLGENSTRPTSAQSQIYVRLPPPNKSE